MANYRSLHVKVWSDPVIESLPANAKYLFVYLLTSPARNESALYSISLKRISSDTGLTIKAARSAMLALEEVGRVRYDQTTCTVWVVNAVKHQALNENCVKSILTDLEKCSSKPLQLAFAVFYDGFKGLETHPDRFPMGSSNPSIGIGTGTGIGTGKEGGVGETPKKSEKISYAEFVQMTVLEYQTLAGRLGSEAAAKECIEILDNYKGSSGTKYKSDYRAILSWVIREWQKRRMDNKEPGRAAVLAKTWTCEYCKTSMPETRQYSHACDKMPKSDPARVKELIGGLMEKFKA